MDAKTPESLSPGGLVRERREIRGWSQTRLAKEAGTNQQTIEKIENGKIKQSRLFPKLAEILGVSLEKLIPSLISAPAGAIPGSKLVGEKDLPVYAAAQGGRGVVVLSTDPIEWVARPEPLARVKDGYGVMVVEESMVPEFRPGDIALVHPHLPPIAGQSCVFYSESADGTVTATIKHLRKVTADKWHVCQWNPPPGEKQEFTLKRSEWQKCHVTVGRYSRR